MGIGTGCNISFYPAGAEVVGIDTSRAMLARARERVAKLGRRVWLRQMDLFRLDFADGSFDTVAFTFVLLCLPDGLQRLALEEFRRVTRPDGRILIVDCHGSSRRRVRNWTKAMARWLRWAFAARFDPVTERYLAAAGLEVEMRRSFIGDSAAMPVLRHTARDESDAAAA